MSYKDLETPDRESSMYRSYQFIFELKGKIMDSFIKDQQYTLTASDIVCINEVLGVVNLDSEVTESDNEQIDILRSKQQNPRRWMSETEYQTLKELLYKGVPNEIRTKRRS